MRLYLKEKKCQEALQVHFLSQTTRYQGGREGTFFGLSVNMNATDEADDDERKKTEQVKYSVFIEVSLSNLTLSPRCLPTWR